MDFIRREPAVFAGLVQACVIALLNTILAFGVQITPDQSAAINGITATVLAIALSMFTRQMVTPNRSLPRP